MAKKRTTTELSEPVVKSTAEVVDSFMLVSAFADPKIKESAEAENRHWRDIHTRNMEAMKELAAGREIVREARFRRTCLWLGALERETPRFYIYRRITHGSLSKPPELIGGEERITKSKAHLEPCENCADHPQTRNTQRWTW